MAEKLEGSSKIKTAKRPRTIRNRTKQTEPKLGLLTEKKRRMVSFRMTVELIDIADSMLEKYRKEIFHGMTRTDIFEAALWHASKLPTKEFVQICTEYGLQKKEV